MKFVYFSPDPVIFQINNNSVFHNISVQLIHNFSN